MTLVLERNALPECEFTITDLELAMETAAGYVAGAWFTSATIRDADGTLIAVLDRDGIVRCSRIA